MIINIFGKASMFLSSYLFLFLALLVKNYDTNFFWIMLLFSIMGTLSLFAILNYKVNPDTKKISKINRKNDQVIGYLATYILPFMGFSYSNLRDVIAVLIITVMIAVLYIKADLVHVNPTLMLFGYNIFEVILDDGLERILITKKNYHDLIELENISFFEIEDRYIIIERGN